MIFLIEPNNNYGNRQQTAGKNKGLPNCWATVQMNPIITVMLHIFTHKRLNGGVAMHFKLVIARFGWPQTTQSQRLREKPNWNHIFKLHIFRTGKCLKMQENSLHISLWLSCSLSLFCVKTFQEPLQIFLKFSSVFIVFTFGIGWGDKPQQQVELYELLNSLFLSGVCSPCDKAQRSINNLGFIYSIESTWDWLQSFQADLVPWKYMGNYSLIGNVNLLIRNTSLFPFCEVDFHCQLISYKWLEYLNKFYTCLLMTFTIRLFMIDGNT